MLEWLFVPLIAGTLLVLVLPRRFTPWVALLSVGLAGAVGISAIRQLLQGAAPQGLGGMLRLDAIGGVVLGLVLALGFLAALVSSQTETWPRRFYALLLTFTSTMALAATADNLGLLWASVEATTLSSALLVGHHRTRQSTEAAWKYLILSSTGILFAFVATLVLVLASRSAGQTSLSAADLIAAAPQMDGALVRLAMVLATVGYGTKAGIVPYHFWLPDAHSEAPSPVSALLSGVLLSCALLALHRVVQIGQAAGAPLVHLDFGLGALSVLVGGILVMAARTYKRMLAYSSVENMGLVLFALGINTPLALAGAYLHIVSHGFAKSLAFFSAGRVHHHLGTTTIADAGDLLHRTPIPGRSMAVGLVALAGLPPFGPFASKLMILAAATDRAPVVYLVPLFVGVAIAFVGFLRQVSILMPPHFSEPRPKAAATFSEPWTVTLSLLLLICLSVITCLAGPSLIEWYFAVAPQGLPR